MSLSDKLNSNIKVMRKDELKIFFKGFEINSKEEFGDYFLINNLFLFPKDKDIYEGLVITYAEGFYEQDRIKITHYHSPELAFKSVVTKDL